MASNSNRGNQALVPEAREALNKFKMESASEVVGTGTANRSALHGRGSQKVILRENQSVIIQKDVHHRQLVLAFTHDQPLHFFSTFFKDMRSSQT